MYSIRSEIIEGCAKVAETLEQRIARIQTDHGMTPEAFRKLTDIRVELANLALLLSDGARGRLTTEA